MKAMVRRMMRRFRVTITLSLLLACGACERSDLALDGQPSWTQQRDSVIFHAVGHSDDPCRDCVVLDRISVIGDSTGPGFVEETFRALEDARGRFWLTQRDGLKLFGPGGTFVSIVGRSGEGPMEFSYPLPVRSDSLDRVHVLDPGNDRESILSLDLELVRDTRLPIASIHDVAPIPGGHDYFVNSWVETPAGIGLPFHIVGDSIERSFGGTNATQTPFLNQRLVTVDSTGRWLFSSKEYEYEIEAWTRDGKRVGGVMGPQLNEHEVQPTFFNREDNPIPNRIRAIQALDSTTLMVVIRRPRANWRDVYEDRVYPQGYVGLQLPDSVVRSDVYDSFIEVVDLEQRSIVASRRMNELFQGFAGKAVLFENLVGEDGLTPRVAFWRVGFKRPLR